VPSAMRLRGSFGRGTPGPGRALTNVNRSWRLPLRARDSHTPPRPAQDDRGRFGFGPLERLVKRAASFKVVISCTGFAYCWVVAQVM
jgi:hypothetical protein